MMFLHGERISFRTMDAKDYDLDNPSPHLRDLQSNYMLFTHGAGVPLPPTFIDMRKSILDTIAKAAPGTLSAQSDAVWAVQLRVVGKENERRECIGVFQIAGVDSYLSSGFGITIAQEFRGKGYGKEILELGLNYAFRIRGLRRLQSMPQETNPAMIALAKSCGFIEEGRQRKLVWQDGRFVDRVLLSLLQDEYLSR